MEVRAYPIYYKIKDDPDGSTKLKIYLFDIDEHRFISAYYRRHRPFLLIDRDKEGLAKKAIKEANFDGVITFSPDPRGYTRIYVKAPTLIRKLRVILGSRGIQTYEDDIKYLMRVMIDGSVPAKPLRVILSNVERREDVRGELLIGDVVYLEPLEEELNLSSLPVASFDIEVAHPRDMFPKPREHPIFLISLAIAKGDELKFIVLVNKSAFLDNSEEIKELPYRERPVEVRYFNSESQMILEFGKIIAENKIFIISGYNSDSFDWPFLLERAKHLGVYHDLVRLISAAFDDEELRIIEMGDKDPSFSMITPSSVKEKTVFVPGRLNVDIFQLIKLPMFKPLVGNITPLTLKNVAAELGILPSEERVIIDLSSTDMETEWKKDRERVIRYNMDDAYATLKLTFSFLPQMLILSNITNIPIQFIVKWPNSKILTVLFGREAMREGILIPPSPGEENKEEEEKYRGAFVIHPDPSIVKGVAILDFQSLYPNIIVNFNIGTDSLIGTFVREDGKNLIFERDGLERGIKGEEVNLAPFVYHGFVSQHIKESFVSKVVRSMLSNRIHMKKAAKVLFKLYEKAKESPNPKETVRKTLENEQLKEEVKKMVKDIIDRIEQYEDERFLKELLSQAEIMDTKQTAFKFLINSTYGVLGYTRFRWYERRSAESITAFGRWLIMRTREFMEKAGFKVISGDTDSVMITLKDNILWSRPSEDARKTRERYIKEYEEAKQYIQKHLPNYAKHYNIFQPVDDLIPLWKSYLQEKLREDGIEPAEDLESMYKQVGLDKLAGWLGEFCTSHLYKPFNFVLEFDKYFDKALFLMAKNYASVKGEKIQLKGLEAKKRNFSRISRDEQMYLLELMFDLFDYFESLKRGSPDPSLIPDKYGELRTMLRDVKDWDGFVRTLIQFLEDRLRRIITDILDGKYPIEQFVRFTELSKNLDEYESKGSAGVYAAEAEMKEFPDVRYVRGDRIAWVYAMDPEVMGRKKATKSMYARTVSHVMRKGLKIYPMPYVEEITGRYDKILYVFDRSINPSKFLKYIESTSRTLDSFFEEKVEQPVEKRRQITIEDYF